MKLYSNEIVFRGHPDKVCDQISDIDLTRALNTWNNCECCYAVCHNGTVWEHKYDKIEQHLFDFISDLEYNEDTIAYLRQTTNLSGDEFADYFMNRIVKKYGLIIKRR